MRLNDLLQDIKHQGNSENREVDAIAYDSRKVRPGTLFVAIKGHISDGHDYINGALSNGAVAVISNGRSLPVLPVPLVRVRDPRRTLSQLAANFYGHPSRQMEIYGVTGTNGKTTTTYLINTLLNQSGIPCGTLGTLGFSTPTGMVSTGFTTPEAVEVQQLLGTLLKGGIHHVAMEMSSHALVLHRVADVETQVAVFTNLSSEHLDFHGSLESYFKAKLKLFRDLGPERLAVLNADDPYSDRIRKATPARVVTFGFNPKADIRPKHFELNISGIEAELITPSGEISVHSSLIGRFNLANIMAACAVALEAKLTPEQISTSLPRLVSIPGRMERIKNSTPGEVLVDYAHTPDAYYQVLTMVKELLPEGTKIITLFGCGGDRDRTKRPLMARMAERYSKHTIVTSDNPRHEDVRDICADINSGFLYDKHETILNRVDAIKHGMEMLDESSILLILGKGRDDYEQVGDHKMTHSDIETVEGYGR